MYPLTIGLAIENRDLQEQAQACLSELPFRIIVEHQDLGDLSNFLDRLERMRPDVVLVDISGWKEPLESLVASIRSAIGDPMIIALNTTADAGAILAGSGWEWCADWYARKRSGLGAGTQPHRPIDRRAPGSARRLLERRRGLHLPRLHAFPLRAGRPFPLLRFPLRRLEPSEVIHHNSADRRKPPDPKSTGFPTDLYPSTLRGRFRPRLRLRPGPIITSCSGRCSPTSDAA